MKSEKRWGQWIKWDHKCWSESVRLYELETKYDIYRVECLRIEILEKLNLLVVKSSVI